MEDARSSIEENRMFVAVGKQKSDRDSIMKWALMKAKGHMIICVVYVHVPAQMIRLWNGMQAPVSGEGERGVTELRENERQQVDGIIADCLQLCDQAGVLCEILFSERESIAEGILELISEHNIRKLVMGAAAESRYSRKMVKPMSKKANYVLHRAPDFCQIWFVCKGQLVYTREGVQEHGQHTAGKKMIRGRNSEPSVSSTPAELNGFSSPQVLSGHHSSSPTHELENDAERQLDSAKELMKNMEMELVDLLQELLSKSDHIEKLQNQIEKCIQKVEQKEEETVAAEKLMQKYKMQYHELLRERDNAVLVAPKLGTLRSQKTKCSLFPFCSEITMSDLEEATKFKIKEAAYETVYRGFIRLTDVEIKMMPHSYQSIWEKEVDVLSKLRHPNLATLIGVCPEKQALIYEYLPNGSLEERLSCKDNTPPLPWQTRIQIATDLCSAIHFLHSNQPKSIIHGDLKPENIFLDANFVSKLTKISSFDILNGSPYIETMSEEAFPYMDPEFLDTGQLTIKSDVYSYGVILLRLLTGKPAMGLVNKVNCALDNDDLLSILDHTAGDWPFVTARQLTYMALRCCDRVVSNRPDLASEVWRILKPTKISNGILSRPLVHDDQIPSYFICPIFKEIMQDPHFAADGFTYEANAIRGWFEGGHTTSPMTNVILPSCNLIPNRALRSAIQEWLQRHEIA